MYVCKRKEGEVRGSWVVGGREVIMGAIGFMRLSRIVLVA